MESFLGIDYGTRKSGLAYSVGSFCFALKTVPTHTLLSIIPTILSEKHITKIIVGMPYNIDGSMSKHGKRVEVFIQLLQNALDIPVEIFDERLTTSEAKIFFAETGISWDIDAEAARCILEGYVSQIE